MANGKDEVLVCRSVFKSSEDVLKKQFTRKWIELINRIEKDRTVSMK